jgi:hypothetical protein
MKFSSIMTLVALFVLSLGCGRGAPPRTESGRTATPAGSSATQPIQSGAPSSAAVAPAPPPGGDHLFREAEMSGMKVGILRPSRGSEMIGAPLGVNGGRVDSLWEPTGAQFERLLLALIVRFERSADRRGPAVAARIKAQMAGTPSDNPQERYRVQLSGYMVSGKPILHAMFYCESSGFAAEWLDRPLAIDDGGDCYFEAWFDVETGEIPHAFITGVA